MRFDFSTANRIIFGAGTISEVPAAAQSFGQRALVLTDSQERSALLVDQLHKLRFNVNIYQVKHEPTVQLVTEGLAQAREMDCDLIIGIGGGSVLDSGKAIAALFKNPGTIYDYLEVIGKGQPLIEASIPYIAVPTTAGTGSEVTRNSVLSSPEHKVKVSMRSPFMLPRLAVVDPELTYSLPSSITASTGLDALTHLIEPFLSNAANPFTDTICRDGMRRISRSLQRAFENCGDAEAREDMALASLFGGMALANAKLGAAHGFAAPIGGLLHAPHGAVCARLLPLVVETNFRALYARNRNSPVCERFAEISQLLTDNPLAKVEDGIAWLVRIVEILKIPPLSSYGFSKENICPIVEQAKKSSSIKGNPIELSDYELSGILLSAI